MTDRTVVYRIQADVTQARAQMAALGASVRQSADSMTSATAEGSRFRGGLTSLGDTAGKVGLVAAAGLGAAVLKAANFDASMSKVQAATNETAANMESLRQAALDAGAQTAFSATEAAAGIENLAKAGVSTADILDGALAGALDLAAAGEMSVADAAEAAAGAMAQFKLGGDQATKVADLLAAGAGKAQGDVSDMVMALKQAGTVSAQTGLSLDETVGSLSAMAEQSLLGSDAGTSFKTMLAALTPNSKKAADAMAAYNIQAFDAQGNFVGMTELAGQLQAGLGGLTDEQRAMALETIFGSDAVRAASIIYDNGADGIASWTEKVNDAGYAAESAAIKQDNLRGDIEKLGGALETALIGTGSSSQGGLRALTQSLEDTVNAYNNLGEGAKSGVAVTLAATATLGGGLFVFSKMVTSIAATRLALQQLGVTATGTSAMMAAAAKGGVVVLGAALAVAAADLGDTDYSLEQINRQLELLATQGDAAGVFENLGFSVASLGDALKDAAFNDFNMFGMGTAGEIEEIDAALSSLDPEAAADAFAVLVEEGTKAGLTVGEVKDLFPQYAAELELAAKEAEATADTTRYAVDATGELGIAAQKTTEELKAEADALADARKAANDTARGFVNLGDGLNDAKVSLGQWIRQMANQADALNNFTANAQRAGKKGLREGLIRDLQAAGTEGALRLKQLANASEAEIARANAAWLKGEKAVDRYVAATVKVPDSVSTNLTVDAGSAFATFKQVDVALSNLPSVKYIDIVTRNLGQTPQTRAAGGPIFGPGTATSDSIPALLSNGEYVIKAAAVDYYGMGTFDRMNAMRLAGGGSTDRKRRPKRNVEADEEANAARDAAREQREEERARREEDRAALAEQRAERIAEINEAILDGQTRAWDMASDAAKSQVDAAQAMVDSVQGNMDRIGSAATTAFGGSWFSGGGQSGLWTGPGGGGAAGDWRSRATSSISGLQERGALITQLSGLGLTGAALEELLGNQSNAGISAMIGAGEIDDFAALFAQQQSLMQSVGMQAGQAGYGSDMAAANAQLVTMNAQFAALTAAIEAARPITVLEAISAQATAQELARILSMQGAT